MRQLREFVARLAPLPLSVLVTGETGVGKDLVARALHQFSLRTGALVAFNVCAIPDGMFESALFGHVRGAFTGAVAASSGFLAEANGGTVFLDEIGGLPLASQAKLLRAVETREFRPLGARQDRRSDFRVVAATNDALDRLVTEGRFRADLLQRLGAVRVAVPALRERASDIPELIAHFCTGVDAVAAERRFSRDAMEVLCGYSWPGNVRQLRHVVECAIHLAPSGAIEPAHLLPLLRREGMEGASPRLHRERELLDTLMSSGWDVDEAARRLDVHRTTIYRRLKRIEPPEGAYTAPSSAGARQARG